MSQQKNEILNLCSWCIETLGMLSWSMAQIQDHRSCLKKKDGNKPRSILRFTEKCAASALDSKHAILEYCQHSWPRHAHDKHP